jgi:hypothetical protein
MALWADTRTELRELTRSRGSGRIDADRRTPDRRRARMAQFKVVLDGIKLDDKRGARLSNSIQKAVLAELADLDTRGDEASLILEKLGPETRGIIAIRLNAERPDVDVKRFNQLNEQFGG